MRALHLHNGLKSLQRASELALCLCLLVLLASGAVWAQPPADLELAPVTSGLASPVAVRHAGDGSGRLFIVERGGDIEIYDGTQLLNTPFLDDNDLPNSFVFGGEQGLLGLAFHPDYTNNGYFFVNYTESASPPGDCPQGADCFWNTVIARYTVSAGNPNLADPNSEVRILVINQDYGNHNGGDIHFGPDGYLYIGMGDGGSGGDPENRAQSMDTLLGKMLRIDVDGGGFAPDCGRLQNYTVPEDNFFRDGPGGDCDAIWSLGLRNPWRWSFDRLTGDMFIGDVGQNTWEEVSYEPWPSPGGMNWGWRCYEGNNPFDTNGCGPVNQYDFPILEYDQRLPGRQAVTGGFRYRGFRIPGLQGVYIYADYASGEIWFATPGAGSSWTNDLWQDTTQVISSFGEDEQGEVYLVNLNGSIYRFESASSVFGDDFEFGDPPLWSVVVP